LGQHLLFFGGWVAVFCGEALDKLDGPDVGLDLAFVAGRYDLVARLDDVVAVLWG
jgi:hypothetical protein